MKNEKKTTKTNNVKISKYSIPIWQYSYLSFLFSNVIPIREREIDRDQVVKGDFFFTLF